MAMTTQHSESFTSSIPRCAMRLAFALPLAFAIACFATTARAQTAWTGAIDSNVNNPGNWTKGVPGVNGGNMVINDISTNVPVMTSDISGIVDLAIGTGPNTNGRLDQLSGTLSTGFDNWVVMGFNDGSGPATAVYNLADTTGTGGAFTGFAQGSGSLVVGGGSTTSGKLNLGWDANTTSTMNVNTSGTISAVEIEVGSTGGGPTSTFNIDNGTVDVVGNFEVGGNQWSLQGGNSTFNMSGGAINAGGEFWIAGGGTSNSSLTGGQINSGAWFVIGRGGTGTLNMSGGTINAATTNSASFAVLGSFGGSSGTLNLSGGTFNAGDADTASNMLIGEGGTGTLNLLGSGGSVNVFGDLLVGSFNDGSDSGGTGTIGIVADATGLSTINVGGEVNLSSPDGDFLTVDLSAYTGAYTDLVLIDGASTAGEFTGLFQGDLAATDANSNQYFIDYTTAGDVRLTTTAILLNQWDVNGGGSFNLASNWSDNVVPTDNAIFGGVLTADNAPATVTLDSAASVERVTFNNANDYILAGPSALTLTGTATVNAVAGRHWLRAELAGTNGLNATGGGELVLDAANSFSGGLSIDGANVAVVNAGAIPAGNNISVQDGGELRFWGSNNAFFGDGAPLDEGGNGTGTATGLDPNSTLTIAGTVAIDATSLLEVNDGANVAFNGVIRGEGTVTVNTGSTVALAAANTYTGITTVNSGSVTVSNATALGAGDGTAATRTVVSGNENDGTLVLAGNITVANELLEFAAREGAAVEAVGLSSAGNNTWSGNVLGVVGGTQYNIESTAGTLTLAGTISAPDTGARNFVFSGDGNFVVDRITDAVADANGVITGASTAANVNVIKRGSGTMTITTNTTDGNDYHFGNTTVEGGTLVLTASAGSDNELFSAVTTVREGATLDITSFTGGYDVGIGDELAGGGTIDATGAALNLFDDNSVTPGDSVGTLKVLGPVSITSGDGGGALNYELGNTTTIGGTENDLISISGALTTDGAPSMALNVRAIEGSLAAGSYRLINHAGGATNFSAVTPQVVDADGNALQVRQGLSVSGATAGQVNLAVSGAAANLFWKGSPDNNWSTAGTANFGLNSVGGTPTSFLDLDNVTFGSGANTTTVNVASNVAPNTMTVNGGQNYTFSGSDINATTVTVNGNATASFSNAIGGDVVAASTGTVAGSGTFKNSVTAQAGGTLRVGGATLRAGSSAGLLDNFDSYSTGATTTATDGVWNNEGTNLANANIVASDKSQSLQVIGGAAWSGTERDLTNSDAAVGLGETKTFFWQVQAYDTVGDTGGFGFYDLMMGLSHDVANVDGTNAWQDFTVRPIVDNAATTPFVAALAPVTPYWQAIAPNQWFNLWVELNNDPTNPTYDAYVEINGERVLFAENATWGPDGGPGAGEALNAMAFMAAGRAGSEFLIDNIWFGEGIQTTDPTVTPWTGSTVLRGETMNVLGDVSLEAGSTVSFNIATSGINDLLAIEGNLDIADGAILEVLLDSSVSATSLAGGDSWDLFDFASVSGTFDEQDFLLPTLSGNLVWDTSNLLVDGTLAIIGLGLQGDFNDDGVVNLADYTVWRDNLGADESVLPSGTSDNSGLVDVGDYNLWKSNFGATGAVSSAVAAANVPEPSAAVLLAGLLGCATMVLRSRR